MKILEITDKTNNQHIGNKIKAADSFWKRFKGLMLTKQLSDSEGLLIEPCNSIHMMFMRYPIDALFLDTQGNVRAIYENLKPWIGLTKIHRGVRSVLELKAGTVEAKGIKLDDKLEIKEIQQ